jgi:NhaP-type Na+/H+ or K+/H+ antiporter
VTLLADSRFYNIVLYQVALSVVIGAVIGFISRKVLRFAEERR